MMRKTMLLCALMACVLVACRTEAPPHKHVPDNADCQHVQYCAECREQLAEQGSHDYPDVPETEKDGYQFFVCRVCGNIKIVNEDGLPVVPVE